MGGSTHATEFFIADARGIVTVWFEQGVDHRRLQEYAARFKRPRLDRAGGRCERQIVTRHLSSLLQYHDPPSLMAGKVHALLARRYAKGRDWYDLVWYLSQRPLVDDVGPFLERPQDAALITRENLLGLLQI